MSTPRWSVKESGEPRREYITGILTLPTAPSPVTTHYTRRNETISLAFSSTRIFMTRIGGWDWNWRCRRRAGVVDEP